jgi:hypothetical protein
MRRNDKAEYQTGFCELSWNATIQNSIQHLQNKTLHSLLPTFMDLASAESSCRADEECGGVYVLGCEKMLNVGADALHVTTVPELQTLRAETNVIEESKGLFAASEFTTRVIFWSFNLNATFQSANEKQNVSIVCPKKKITIIRRFPDEARFPNEGDLHSSECSCPTEFAAARRSSHRWT